MLILPKPVFFEWDKGNFDKNYQKHKVTNKEAEEVFDNEPKFIFEDKKHSETEKRYGIFGRTKNGKLLSIVFIIRNNKIRIITARNMSKKERRSYEKIKINPKI
ncbi:hypothetical protein COS31_02005 [Candidatus Roizmanbacteria bacterium CG02_land_8_20_14_3_00_36_15]|uniref:BrnT family toxin n=2 Tax=Candidatus Roizmaniibacteriota TaxID=1752723 RepID=A0A2M8KM24_9BACT|nr:MAG: hypothetical protein COS51_04865 [Candidatus Roizmanbacteria bacterium CG03_land_8_20_14_0_80_36_21]PIV37954.1 MAG: hypothetical protein COS31_02005 [Candidatus Roizmanbacteria bacterium CG02_land_8_20_14_3_00_36_15]PIY69624.1 MAG: hypothetical protein COY89_05445 [Candidatus Roizmanbacteria bacterium CG_4_10_14_0_8_um_filter_36_36]PJA52585.1 MAG: hypothetical protein CO166_05205 [Candidatus Roizmanbacteria bacterium CG_4_9_14_3_um_filter_36_11]PJC81534.1 MAG: hypothetical protein CO007